MKLDQAHGVIGGMVERSSPQAPSRSSFPRQGKCPCSIQGSIRSKVAPSSPRMRTLYLATGTGMHLRRRPVVVSLTIPADRPWPVAWDRDGAREDDWPAAEQVRAAAP